MWFIVNTRYYGNDNIRNMRKVSKYQGISKSSHLYQDYGVGERPLFFFAFLQRTIMTSSYMVFYFRIKKEPALLPALLVLFIYYLLFML